MIKINQQHHAICEKCEKPFTDPNAVVLTELNFVNATFHDIILCHVNVNRIPGFKSNDWADRMTMYHADCFPGLAKDQPANLHLIETLKNVLTNVLTKRDAEDVYRYLHFSLGCRI